MSGLMKVKFSEPIIIPSNYTEFNDSILNIHAVDYTKESTQRLAFTWKIKMLTDNIMDI
jgi:hypothetical protein